MDINFIKESLEETKQSYFSSKKNLLWLEQYTLETQNFKDYEGREILELLQNADDAQSSDVKILLNTAENYLSVTNSGDKTILFSEAGIRSIMASHLSPKKEDIKNKNKLIGAKGLGFKSVLNWASEIKVKSDNIDLCFGKEIVNQFWEELKVDITDASKYELIAQSEGRDIPLPILRLPKVELWKNPIPKTTIIELSYNEDKTERIKEALNNFRPETLLFLHNLQKITIIIDGTENVYSISSHRINDQFCEIAVGKDLWIRTKTEGTLDNGQNYEVAAAFCLNSIPQESYEIYSFFPTDEKFPFPCILHASLALNASRKALQTGEEINDKMMYFLADRMIQLAEYLKEYRHDWNPYKIVFGSGYNTVSSNIFVSKLKQILKEKSRDLKLVPIIDPDCQYAKASETYYYNDSIFDFIKDTGKSIFRKMRLKGTPDITLNNFDFDHKKHIQEYARLIPIENIDLLAHFIKLICNYYKDIRKAEHMVLLRDDSNELITCTAYLNTGRIVSDIPDCKNIKYVNKALAESLVKEFGYEGKNKLRDLANTLKNIVDVQASDITGIKKQLIFSQNDENKLTRIEKQQILRCLYNLYLENKSEFSESKEKCYLLTEDGKWEVASSLVFADSRFPDGINHLNLNNKLYQKNKCVAYPEFLATEESSNISIQDFFSELGVNKYFPTTVKCYGDDDDYLDLNGISYAIKQNCSSYRTGTNYNMIEIPANIENWKDLNLTDLVKLINKSGLTSKIADKENKGLVWYHGKRMFGPEVLKTSYLAYLIKKYTIAKELKHYIISTNKWIINNELTQNFQYDKDELTQLMLKKLGAKKDYSDFSINELYNLINMKAEEWEETKNYKGAQEFYHNIKQAIDLKPDKPQLPESQTLKMLCKINGAHKIMDSRKIYYSDNKGAENLRSILPVLEMRLRDGEEQVHKYFGCQRFKDIHTQLINHSENSRLTYSLGKLIEKLKPYILAITSKDSNHEKIYDPTKKSDLDKLRIEIVKSASYKYDIEILYNEFQMTEGDIIYNNFVPCICSISDSLKNALENPKFCNSIAEIICITLKLSTNENIDKFYRLLKSTDRELNYIVKSEVDENLWHACQNAFGISDGEKEFWQKVFKVNNKTLDELKLKTETRNYISQSLEIGYDRTTPDNFILYHKQQLQLIRESYINEYLITVYSNLIGKSENEQKTYLEYKERFCENQWIDDLLTGDLPFHISLGYQDILKYGMKKYFNFNATNSLPDKLNVPSIHEEYLMGHSLYDLSLSMEDKSLLYFDGKQMYFRNLIDELFPKTEQNLLHENQDSELNTNSEYEPLDITIIKTSKRNSSNRNTGNHTSTRKNKRKLTEAEKKRLGNEAEDKVLRTLQNPNSGYEVGIIYSEHLNPKGSDKQGYDLEYRRKGEILYRCLEIKHSDGKSIIISRHEFEVSQSIECFGRYDVALVVGNSIQIWENAFTDESLYTKSADDYIVSFNTHEIK